MDLSNINYEDQRFMELAEDYFQGQAYVFVALNLKVLI
jgi:hypothetical protein